MQWTGLYYDLSGHPLPTFPLDARHRGAMTGDILAGLPSRRGHFLLESGYHTDIWLTLDELFADPVTVAPLVAALADRLRAHAPEAVCGPLLGGAFLAQAIATRLGARFYYTEPVIAPSEDALFAAHYRLPPALRRPVCGQRVAVVDDVISAGSSVRATVAALDTAGASTVAVGALAVLGDPASSHFEREGIPVESLQRSSLDLWVSGECPLCESGRPLEDPRQTDRSGTSDAG